MEKIISKLSFLVIWAANRLFTYAVTATRLVVFLLAQAQTLNLKSKLKGIIFFHIFGFYSCVVSI